MIEVSVLLVLNSLLIFGFYHATTYDGWEVDDAAGKVCRTKEHHEWRNILWFIRYYGLHLPDWIQRPLFQCPKCMASVHSVVPFTLFIYEGGLPEWYTVFIIGYIFALSGLNGLIQKL